MDPKTSNSYYLHYNQVRKIHTVFVYENGRIFEMRHFNDIDAAIEYIDNHLVDHNKIDNDYWRQTNGPNEYL